MTRGFVIAAVLVTALLGGAAALSASLRVSPAPRRLLPMVEAERLLLEAARAGEVEIIEGLVRAGTSAETRDDRGFTPLILAAYHGHLPAVDALLRLGAAPCTGDHRGNTALMGAAFKGYREIVSRLAQQSCAVDQKNAAGQTALMFARLFGREEASRLLKLRGASAEIRDTSGRSASDWARTQGPPAPGQRVLEGLRKAPVSGRLVMHITTDRKSFEGSPDDIELRAGDSLIDSTATPCGSLMSSYRAPETFARAKASASGWLSVQPPNASNCRNSRSLDRCGCPSFIPPFSLRSGGSGPRRSSVDIR